MDGDLWERATGDELVRNLDLIKLAGDRPDARGRHDRDGTLDDRVPFG